MQKKYPKLEIPQDIKCLRWPNDRGTFDGRADSEVYVDETNQRLYKKYPYQPKELAIYHAIQTNLALHQAIIYHTAKDQILIEQNQINEIVIQFLPLKENEVYTTQYGGTITTPTYIPWPTVMDLVEKETNLTWVFRQIFGYIKNDVGMKLKLPHTNFYPNISPSNTKYKIHNNTLYLLITDVWWPEFGVYDMIRNFQHPRDQERLHFQDTITPQTQEIIDLFLQK